MPDLAAALNAADSPAVSENCTTRGGGTACRGRRRFTHSAAPTPADPDVAEIQTLVGRIARSGWRAAAAGGVGARDSLIRGRELGASRGGASATAAILDEYRRRETSGR